MTFLFPTPITYDGNDSRYLQRDGARFAQYLSEQGHIAKKIIISDDSIKGSPSSSLLEAAPLADWHNSAFWAKYDADSVLLYGGFAPRMLAIAKAIRPATPFLALKLDSSLGVTSPFYKPLLMIRKKYHILRQNKSIPISFVFSLLWWIKQSISSKKSFYREYFPLFDLITAENDIAAKNTKKYFNSIGLTTEAEKVIVLPHPVSSAFCLDTSLEKKNQIIVVAGDWSNPLKCGVLLLKTLKITLTKHQDYKAIIIGNNTSKLKAIANSFSQSIRDRIQFLPAMQSDEIAQYYKESKIHIITSGSESGPITASEALSCGCSLIFSKNLYQLKTIADEGFASISHNRSAATLASALTSEITKWQSQPNYSSDIHNTYSPRFNISILSQTLTPMLHK